MPTRTKTEITIQTRQRTVVRALRVRCPQCGAEVSITAADGLTQVTPDEIDVAHLHPALATSVAELICADSVATDSEAPIENSSND